jgi:hypothetical protein
MPKNSSHWYIVPFGEKSLEMLLPKQCQVAHQQLKTALSDGPNQNTN